MEDSLETILLTMSAAFFPQVGVRRSETTDAPSEGVSTAIDFRGDWSGSLVLRASSALARRLTAEFYGREDCGAEEVRDLLCELANVLGGNLRGSLPSRPEMSLPRVVEGDLLGSPAHRVAMEVEGEPLCLELYQA